jgi:hypothetical protein
VEHLKGLTRKHSTRLERLARDKHSSLLRKYVKCSRNKFYDTGPCTNALGEIKLINISLGYFCPKYERRGFLLSLISANKYVIFTEGIDI